MALRIAFFGLPLAALLLDADGHDLRVVVLSPIEAPGRRRLVRKLGAARVLDAADADDGLAARLAAAEIDLLVSWFWTRRLPESVLDAARLGGIGVHPSLLPRHRGPNPFFWAIDSGDATTGVTVHRLSDEYDRGDTLAQIEVPIEERDAWQLARALDRPSLIGLRRVVAAIAEGRAPIASRQDEARATWAPEPDGVLLRADWSWPRARVLRRIRALSPVPGLALEMRGVRFFVTRASACDCPEPLEPGEAAVVGDPPERVVVRAGDGGVGIDRAVFGQGPREGEEIDAQGLAAVISRAATTV